MGGAMRQPASIIRRWEPFLASWGLPLGATSPSAQLRNFSCDCLLGAGTPRGGMEVLRPRRKRALTRSVVLPTHCRILIRDLAHRDAILDRADGSAQITPNARFLDDLDHRSAIVARQAPNGLMRAVLAGSPAQLALDALVLIDMREEVVVEIEVFPLRDPGQTSISTTTCSRISIRTSASS